MAGTSIADLAELGLRAKSASRVLAAASGSAISQALEVAADLLEERSDGILAANRADISRAELDSA
ncbi:MAG: gamma-glutamyl-phosphate reductase, partial [Acidimicrobiales bacterium]